MIDSYFQQSNTIDHFVCECSVYISLLFDHFCEQIHVESSSPNHSEVDPIRLFFTESALFHFVIFFNWFQRQAIKVFYIARR